MGTRRQPAMRIKRDRGIDYAVVTLRDPVSGRRRDIRLGRAGTAEAHQQYARVLERWNAGAVEIEAMPSKRVPMNLQQLSVRYQVEHLDAAGYSRGERAFVDVAIAAAIDVHGSTPVREFGPLALREVRLAMIARGWKRQTVNKGVRRVVAMFAWASSWEILPDAIHQALKTVPPLRAGRSHAAESEPVKPVPAADILAIEPHVTPAVWAMVQLQWVTGMRPGELVIMRTVDIEQSGDVWIYTPTRHKTQHHGIERKICIGPRGQAIINDVQTADLTAPLFPYTVDGYRRAITRACERAGVPGWTPNRLRHNFATEVRSAFGLDASQAVLGHRHLDTTQIYAEVNAEKALSAVKKLG